MAFDFGGANGGLVDAGGGTAVATPSNIFKTPQQQKSAAFVQSMKNAPAIKPAYDPGLNGMIQRNLPLIGGIGGGIAGGIVGGPAGAVVGAGLGGSLGEAGKQGAAGQNQVTNHVGNLQNVLGSLTNPANLKQDAIQGGEQGALTLVGEQVVNPLLKLVGGKLAGTVPAMVKTASSGLSDLLSKGAEAPTGISDLTQAAQRSINKNLPQDMSLFSKLGVKTLDQLKNAADMITGGMGHLSSMTHRAVENASPVSIGNITDAISNATKNISDNGLAKMVETRLQEITGKLGVSGGQAASDALTKATEATAGKIGATAPAANVLDALQHAEGMMSGLRNSIPDQAALKDALHGVVNSLSNALHNNSGADLAMKTFTYGPEEAQAIMQEATQKGIPKIGQYIIDTVNNAQKLAENRSAQAPFVRASQAIQGAENAGKAVAPGVVDELGKASTAFRATYSGLIKPALLGTIRGITGNPLTQAAGTVLGAGGKALGAAASLPAGAAIGDIATQALGRGGAGVESAIQGLAGAASNLPPKTYIGGPVSGAISAVGNLVPRGTPQEPAQGTNFTQPSDNINEFLQGSQGVKLSSAAQNTLSGYRDGLSELDKLQTVMNNGGGYGQVSAALTGSAQSIAKALGLGTSKAALTNVIHQLPSNTDSPQQAQQKLQTLKDHLDTVTEENLAKAVSEMKSYGGLDQYLQGATQ